MMCMVFSSMFIAILTQWYFQVHKENANEKLKLAREVGPLASDGFFKIVLRTLLSLWGRSDSEEARFDDAARDVQKALRLADFTDSEWVREAVASDTRVLVGDLTKHFRGDDVEAYNFVQKVRDLADMEFDLQQGPVRRFTDKSEMEGQEKERLQNLQATVASLEMDLKHLRGALHDSYIARTVAGQAIEGYRVEHVQDGVPIAPGAIAMQDS